MYGFLSLRGKAFTFCRDCDKDVSFYESLDKILTDYRSVLVLRTRERLLLIRKAMSFGSNYEKNVFVWKHCD